MTAAQTALQTLDIVEEICQCVSDRRTLTYLTRVNKVFLSPALDNLWEELESVVPLLRLFSSFHLNHVEIQENSGYRFTEAVYILDSEISDDEWSRFHTYAGRVRRLSVATGTEPRHCGEPLQRLYELNGSKALCPRLRELNWAHEHLHHSGLVAFLSPTISRLHFAPPNPKNNQFSEEYDNYDVVLAGFLVTMVMRLPSLKSLSLGMFHSSCHERLIGLHELQSLTSHIRHLDDSLVPTLAHFAHLSFLHLKCFDKTRQNTNIGTAELRSLPSLRKLELDISASTAECFLNAFSAPLLQTLDIRFEWPVSRLNLQAICASIATRHPSIIELSLVRNLDFDALLLQADLTNTRIIDIFGPLRALHHLKKVALLMWGEHPSICEDVVQLVQNWPVIEEMKIKPCSSQFFRTDTLVDIIRHCRNLKLLELPRVDFGPVMDEETELPPSSAQPSAHSLQFLHIAPSNETRQPDRVATFLRSLFPVADLQDLQMWNAARQNEAFTTYGLRASTRDIWWQRVLDEWQS